MEKQPKEKVSAKIARLVEPAVESIGLELVDVEYVKEGKEWFLRIYIYKKDGVTIDDCVDATHLVNEILDREDPVADSYTLEVSSPGLGRPFRTDADFERYKGEEVEVGLFAPLDGVKVFVGELAGLINESVVIICDGEEKAFPYKTVSTVKRTVNF